MDIAFLTALDIVKRIYKYDNQLCTHAWSICKSGLYGRRIVSLSLRLTRLRALLEDVVIEFGVEMDCSIGYERYKGGEIDMIDLLDNIKKDVMEFKEVMNDIISKYESKEMMDKVNKSVVEILKKIEKIEGMYE